ncbi:MAG: GEVED domain-containing protein [candidate division KSB1 bacterium]|nr:GEVED domain-containing protein [candidate division KSB1 bacterium]
MKNSVKLKTGTKWSLLFVLLLSSLQLYAQPTVNGLFYGDGDDAIYTLYSTSEYGSGLYYTVHENTLYVALVVHRSVNDCVFSPLSGGGRDRDPYMKSADWKKSHDVNTLTNSEFAGFTLTIGSTSYDWQQGYAYNPSPGINTGWVSDNTTGNGLGTAPPGYTSASSFTCNLNNYAQRYNSGTQLFDLEVYGTGVGNWKSAWDSNENVNQMTGYPASGQITYDPNYEWEWSMVYEWSVDLSSFGPNPIYVFSGSSHHSPMKTDYIDPDTGDEDENDDFPPGDETILSDFGDLPDTYGTRVASNGAQHYIIANGAYLGTGPDSETEGQPDVVAGGDNMSSINDEDGIVLSSIDFDNSTAVLTVKAGAPGYLSAFIDFDGDGTLDAVTLNSSTGPATVTTGTISETYLSAAGTYNLTIQWPTLVNDTYSRFRFTNNSGDGGASATGVATTGEVEDYYWDTNSYTPVAVALSQLNAKADEDGIHISWTAEQEIDHAGYSVLRSLSQQGPFEMVSHTLITQATRVQGTVKYYEFTDRRVEPGRTYYYMIRDVGLNGAGTDHGPLAAEALSTGIEELNASRSFRVYGNYPNPFNPSTTIEYDLPDATVVSLQVYDIHGRLIRTLVDGMQNAGRQHIEWDATNGQGVPMSSGLYIYQFRAGDVKQTGRMMYLK